MRVILRLDLKTKEQKQQIKSALDYYFGLSENKGDVSTDPDEHSFQVLTSKNWIEVWAGSEGYAFLRGYLEALETCAGED